MSRPFFSARIEYLEALAGDKSTPLDQLTALRSELDHRHTWRALKLKKNLDRRLNSGEAWPLSKTKKGATPPADVKLTKFNLSTRAKNVLAAHKIVFASELARLTESQLLRYPNVGRKTCHELRNVLKSLGMNFGKEQPELDLQAGGRSSALLTIDEPGDLAGALKAHVDASTASERNSTWSIEHFGWDGIPGRTLESIGRSAGVTRERVRQVAAKCSARLQEREVVPKPLRSALRIVNQNAPLLQSKLDRLLAEAGLSSGPFHIESIKSAAEVFGLRFPYQICPGPDPIVVPKRTHKFSKKLIASARTEVSARGCISIDQLSELSIDFANKPLDRDLILSILAQDPTFSPLPSQQDWWWRPGSVERRRNRAANTVRKVLAACPEVTVDDLRYAIRRPFRARGHAPPRGVLLAMCRELPFARVSSNWIIRNEEYDWTTVLTKPEQALTEIFASSPVLSPAALFDAAVSRGVGENHIQVIKAYSPLLWRPTPSSYALVGADIPVGLVDEVERNRRPHAGSLAASGWTSAANVYLVYRLTDGLKRSSMPSMPAAFKTMLQGQFRMIAPEEGISFDITVSGGIIGSLRRLFVVSSADEGDSLLLLFKPQSKECEAWVGGAELSRAMVDGNPENVIASLHRRIADAADNSVEDADE